MVINMVLNVRAMRTIDTSVEQPTISYVNWTKNRDTRRKLLAEHYIFECQCKRCAEHQDKDFDFNRYQLVYFRDGQLGERAPSSQSPLC